MEAGTPMPARPEDAPTVDNLSVMNLCQSWPQPGQAGAWAPTPPPDEQNSARHGGMRKGDRKNWVA